MIIWITGLAGSGKTTIAKHLFKKIKVFHPNTIHLDGDMIRDILGNRYGHEIKDRLETAFIYSRLCKCLAEQDNIVIMSTISLFHRIHDFNREGDIDYYEIFLDVDKKELIKRNKKELYDKQSKNVMGVHQEPEFPKNPDLVLKNDSMEDIEKNVNKILFNLQLEGNKHRYLDKTDLKFSKKLEKNGRE